MPKNSRKLGARGALLKNTIMLYLLTFSSYLMSFFIFPYETRVLDTGGIAKMTIAQGMMVYFQLCIDFGFLLSATEEVSWHREDKRRLGQIFSIVTTCKLILSGIGLVVLVILCRLTPAWRGDLKLYVLYYLATALAALLPDYLYRGMEQMTSITVRTVLIRSFTTVMILLLVKRPQDYVIIPILNIIGNGVALGFVLVHLKRAMGIWFQPFSFRQAWQSFRRSSVFFFSRIASSIYTSSNALIISLLSSDTVALACYGAAEKVVTAAKNGMSPISDSLYPYMVRHRDFRLVKKVMLLVMPVIVAGCVVVGVFAEPLCIWFFGPTYGQAATVLRCLLPVVAVILPSYIFGFPMLSAMGLTHHANYAVVLGSALHVVGLVVLYFTGRMNFISLALMVSFTETVILLYRVIVVVIHRDRLRKDWEKDHELT